MTIPSFIFRYFRPVSANSPSELTDMFVFPPPPTVTLVNVPIPLGVCVDNAQFKDVFFVFRPKQISFFPPPSPGFSFF